MVLPRASISNTVIALKIFFIKLQARYYKHNKLKHWKQQSLAFLQQSYSDINTPLSMKDWTDVSVTCDFGTKAIYTSVCQLLEQFKEELQKLPAICRFLLTPVKTKLQRHLVADIVIIKCMLLAHLWAASQIASKKPENLKSFYKHTLWKTLPVCILK